jgi:hypothetical protein
MFLAELRHDGLQHRHWGMEQIHGSEKSREVMERAHTALLQHVLRTPLKRLVGDAEKWLEQDPKMASRCLDNWREYLGSSVTPTARSGAKKHLSSVLLAISILLKDHVQSEKGS